MKGWHGNSHKHSLASKGIKTVVAKGWLKNPDYTNPKDVMFTFWKSNIENDYSNFNFDEAFDIAQDMVEMYADQSIQEHQDLTFEEIVRSYENDEMIFGIYFDDYILAKMYLKLRDFRPINIKDKIFLMDELIDMEHRTGSIWDTYDERFTNVDDLRKEFDRWYTGVRRFR